MPAPKLSPAAIRGALDAIKEAGLQPRKMEFSASGSFVVDFVGAADLAKQNASTDAPIDWDAAK